MIIYWIVSTCRYHLNNIVILRHVHPIEGGWEMNSQHQQRRLRDGGWRISEYMLMISLVHSEMFMLPYNNKLP